MNESAPSNGRTPWFSRFLWISGALLWLIVGVLFYVNYFRDNKPAGTIEVVQTPANGEAVPRKSPGGLVEPSAIWSSEGIGDFSLTERSGETVTKETLLGRPWIVGFIFTRCAGPCPRVTGQMAQLQKQLAETPVRLVTMTVDPDYDTPEILTRYANVFGADETKWLFLTGDKTTMYRYIEEHFKMPVQEMQGEDRKPGFEVLHTTNLLLVDSKGVVRGKYNAEVPEEMAKLRRDAQSPDL